MVTLFAFNVVFKGVTVGKSAKSDVVLRVSKLLVARFGSKLSRCHM